MIQDLIASTCSIEIETLDPDVLFHCDHALLQNALLNIVMNSRDAIDEPGKQGLIKIETRMIEVATGDNHVLFSVTDSGAGIDPKIIERATDPYFITKRQSKGTGIGLSMVHGFSTQCGSRLQIQSTPNCGTKVVFSVPIGTPTNRKVITNSINTRIISSKKFPPSASRTGC